MRFLKSFTLGVAFAASNVLGETQDIASRDLIHDLINKIESAVDCAGCQGVITTMKGIALLGDGVFVAALTEVCKVSGAEDSDVCTGLIKSEGPTVRKAIKAMKLYSDNSKEFCISLFGLCSYPATKSNAITFPKPKPSTKRPDPSGQKPLQVAHISDTHVDLSYTTGANFNCTKPICCRPYTDADKPGTTQNPAGPWGNHNCDAPENLEISMFKAINNLNPAFSIFTGDVAAHDIWLVNQQEVTQDLNETYTNMHALKQVYPAVGNHDTAPVNLFAPQSLGGGPQWTYDEQSHDWASWIGPEAAAQADKTLSYSAIYGGKLRVISFNSIFYYTENFYMYAAEPRDPDPSGQFAWLVQQLQAAEDATQRVWLIAHVPSGSGDFFHQYSANFDAIVNRYEATIAALFYGHTHRDEFSLAYSDYSHRSADTAVAMSYIAPSLTPTSGSPSFRMYSIDPVTFGVVDFTTYFANITDPTYQTQGPSWKVLYSAKQQYGSLLSPPVTDPAAELTPSFWHRVTEVFDANDAAFQTYVRHKSRDYDSTPCTGDCKTLTICGLRASRSEFNCVVPKPGIHLQKRELLDMAPETLSQEQRDLRERTIKTEARGQRDECEGSRLKHVLRSFMANYHGFRRMTSDAPRRSVRAS